jgi:hypothetical protein
MFGLGWAELIILVFCGGGVVAATLIAVMVPLAMGRRSNQLAQERLDAVLENERLRAEVDRLQAEIERLKRDRAAGETGISEHPN